MVGTENEMIVVK